MRSNEQALRLLIREQLELAEIAQFQNVDGEWQDDVLIPEESHVDEFSGTGEVSKKNE